MRIATMVVLGSVLAGISTSAQAEPETGSYFLESCGAAVRAADGEAIGITESSNAMFCTAYVAGFLDGTSITVGVTEAKKPYCLPSSGITNDQAVRIFVKFLRANPESLHQSGRVSLMISLVKAFPCK